MGMNPDACLHGGIQGSCSFLHQPGRPPHPATKHLRPGRSILQSLFNLACLPLTTLVEAWMEGRVLMLRWQQLAVERHRQVRLTP